MNRLAALLPILLLSCATATPLPAPPAAGELALLLAQNGCSPHVLMTGRALIPVGGEQVSTRAAVLVSRPDRLRLTLSDALGSAWFLATADEERIFYAAPAQGMRDVFSRRAGAPIRLGGERYWTEDLTGNLPHCLDPATLRAGNLRYSSGVLRHEGGGIKRRWEFYPDGRIKTLSLLRPAVPPARFEFAYGAEAGELTVKINGSATFHFTRVTEVEPPPASAFKPPEGY